MIAEFFMGVIFGFFGVLFGIPLVFFVIRIFGGYVIVRESQAKVFILFGKVIGQLDTPGLHFPIIKFGISSLLLPIFGAVHTIDRRLDQVYMRSQPVNSEEGTPMGIGVWYEMRVSNPVDFLFKNSDPDGSLRANVANATVRCLSNMPLARLLTERHGMSLVVREEVSPKSDEWGYRLGSVYIRKVHFRDEQMIGRIEQKVVNRLRQVTSAILQAGENQVNIIKSRAEKEASTEFAKAQAMRPQVVGAALAEIGRDPEIMTAVFDVLEVQRITASQAELTLLPAGVDGQYLSALLGGPPGAGRGLDQAGR